MKHPVNRSRHRLLSWGVLATGLILILSILWLESTTSLAQTTVGETPQALPTVTWTPYVITATPLPPNVFMAAGLVLEATANAATTGTATPTPSYWITATPTNTPLVVTNTPVAENDATATYQAREATAIAITTGTLVPGSYVTATDTPPALLVNAGELPAQVVVVTPTPTASPTPAPPTVTHPPTAIPAPTATPEILVAIDEASFVPTPAPTPTFPAQLIGKIIFQSVRSTQLIGGRGTNVNYYAINGDGSGLSALRPEWNWIYRRVMDRDEYSADRQFHAFVQKEQDYSRRNQHYIFYEFFTYGTIKQLTFFGDDPGFPYDENPRAVNRDKFYGAFDPAWSPTAEKVALVSNTSGNDEIWVVERDVWPAIQLTKDDYGAWDRHPSWSPDGSQIVFMSSRSGKIQLWIMDGDGGNQRQLIDLEAEMWNPVWVKYPDS